MPNSTATNQSVKKTFRLKDTWPLLKEAFAGFGSHKVTKMSGSLAYYTVFSMGPLLVVIISLCGLFLGTEAIEGKVYAVMKGFIGQDTAAQLQDIIRNASLKDKSNIATIVGIITLFIGATSVFAEIQDSINIIWGLRPKPKKGWLKMLRNRFLSFSVIVSLGFLLLVSLVITGIVEAIMYRLQSRYPDVVFIIFYVVNLILTLGISLLIFSVIFKVLPDAKIKWKDVFVGALFTSIMFLLGKFAISIYIAQTKVGSMYGAAGALVVLLVWVYYSAIILYLGAEFTKAYAIKYGSNIYPNDYAVTTKEIEIETGEKVISSHTER